MYFDYTATTKMDEQVLKTYVEVQNKFFANTTSLHSFGQRCNNICEQMKSEIKSILKTDGDCIFTSNATEANNLSIFGLIGEKKGKVMTTKIEHPSVFEVFNELEKKGFEVCYLDIDEKGIINLEQLEKEMNKDVILVSIMWVNNIIGSIQPIDKVIEIVKKYPKAKLHVDAVQGICKIKPNFNIDDIDCFTFSAHKFYGPKGIGAIIHKKGLSLSKRLFGSNAQEGVKPGTYDLGLVVCLTKALKIYYNKIDEHLDYVTKLKSYLINKINNKKVCINSLCENYYSPYIVNISCKGVLGETLVHMFESNDMYVSTGSACSSKLQKPEKTVLALTGDLDKAKSTVRISLSHLTTFDEIDKLVNVINNL